MQELFECEFVCEYILCMWVLCVSTYYVCEYILCMWVLCVSTYYVCEFVREYILCMWVCAWVHIMYVSLCVSTYFVCQLCMWVYIFFFRAEIAQSVTRRTQDPEVAGLSPIAADPICYSVVSLSKTLYLTCSVARISLKVEVPCTLLSMAMCTLKNPLSMVENNTDRGLSLSTFWIFPEVDGGASTNKYIWEQLW